MDRGWGVETSRIKVTNESDDPMLQQMQIISNYIQQARWNYSIFLKMYWIRFDFILTIYFRRDHRYDEVAMLETNLRELQFEHDRMLSNGS